MIQVPLYHETKSCVLRFKEATWRSLKDNSSWRFFEMVFDSVLVGGNVSELFNRFLEMISGSL